VVVHATSLAQRRRGLSSRWRLSAARHGRASSRSVVGAQEGVEATMTAKGWERSWCRPSASASFWPWHRSRAAMELKVLDPMMVSWQHSGLNLCMAHLSLCPCPYLHCPVCMCCSLRWAASSPHPTAPRIANACVCSLQSDPAACSSCLLCASNAARATCCCPSHPWTPTCGGLPRRGTQTARPCRQHRCMPRHW